MPSVKNNHRSSPLVQKFCTSCQQTKPKKEFHRVLTLAQSKALLKNPNLKTRHTLYSSLCQSCRNQRRRRKPLSIADIRNKISSGDIRKDMGENLIKEMREAIPRKRSRVMKEYWQKKKAGWVDELHTNLQKQVTRYASRYYSYKTNLPDDPTPAQVKLLNQHLYNYEEAQRVRKDLMERAKGGEVIATDTKINELIKRRKVGQSNEVF